MYDDNVSVRLAKNIGYNDPHLTFRPMLQEIANLKKENLDLAQSERNKENFDILKSQKINLEQSNLEFTKLYV